MKKLFGIFGISLLLFNAGAVMASTTYNVQQCFSNGFNF